MQIEIKKNAIYLERSVSFIIFLIIDLLFISRVTRSSLPSPFRKKSTLLPLRVILLCDEEMYNPHCQP